MRMAVAQQCRATGEQLVGGTCLVLGRLLYNACPVSLFVGLFDRGSVGSLDLVTTPPYDVVTPAEQQRFRDLSPCNVIRLELGEDLPGDGEQDNKYRRAAAELERWRADGALRPTQDPSFYVYEMRFLLHGRSRRLRGVIGAVELEDWGGSILPHERTMRGPVEDRLRLVRAVKANLSSIQAMFSDRASQLALRSTRPPRVRPSPRRPTRPGWSTDVVVDPLTPT
jgi:hypothetical protein